MTSPQRHDAHNDLPDALTRSDMSLSPGEHRYRALGSCSLQRAASSTCWRRAGQAGAAAPVVSRIGGS
jgi:hypothetical protein